jgi:excisionase family DNA binding protein
MARSKDSPYLSTVQAAEALGVSVSSVKRWVDEGILPAHRTGGGHRKLLRAEVLALVRRGDLPRADLSTLSIAAADQSSLRLDAIGAALYDATVRGIADEVAAVIRRAYEAGTPLESIADRLVAPVMARVGHDWETSRIDVWQEHRGTQLCAGALYQLRQDIQGRAERGRPIAIGGAPEGDPYLLASLLAELVLLDAGWEAINLGPNTPLPSLIRAIRELRPRLVWLSASHLDDTAKFLSAYRELYRAAEAHGAAIAVGGRALTKPIRSTVPYTTHGDGLAHLAAFARTLHPRPRPPRRGRPPAGRSSSSPTCTD